MHGEYIVGGILLSLIHILNEYSYKKIRFNPMEHLNPVDQARQLAAEVVKRLGQLNLHRRELERKLHVANGFFTSLEEKK